jgi:hypothetical protein
VHCSWPVCVQVWRIVDVATAAASKFQFWLGLCLAYGLESLIISRYSFLGHYPWRKVCHLCLAIYPRVYFWNDSLSRLRCSRVASSYGWVTILILSVVKRAHPLYSNKRSKEFEFKQKCGKRKVGF